MPSVRFTATVDAGSRVALTCAHDPAWRRERQLDRVAAGAETFPLPPADDLPDPAAPHHALCAGDGAALSALLGRIAGRRPGAGDVELLGRYLFHTLLGPTLWDDLLAQAG